MAARWRYSSETLPSPNPSDMATVADRVPPGEVDSLTACCGVDETSCSQLVSGVGEHQDSGCAQLASELQDNKPLCGGDSVLHA